MKTLEKALMSVNRWALILLLAAASALARRGVLLQRLDALEALTRLDRIYFDKTGTVTDAHLQYSGVQTLAEVADADAGADADPQVGLSMAASLAACNGFPNDFWGWGGEDDEMLRHYYRVWGRILGRSASDPLGKRA